jgi:hypothetical protein
MHGLHKSSVLHMETLNHPVYYQLGFTHNLIFNFFLLSVIILFVTHFVFFI